MNLATQTDIEGESGRKRDSPPPQTPTPEEIAKFFPQLEIIECLGRGGMGVVYKARQPRLSRWVALKILAPERERDPSFAGRFEKEAQALAQLSHPNIVTIHDFGEAGGMCFLLMEYVDGVTLQQLLAVAGRIAPREAMAIVPQICDALQFAHDQGIIHRDIKPENVLMDRRGRVKVADFGLAKVVGESGGAGGSPPVPAPQRAEAREMLPPASGATSENLTRERVMGTPHYMAPEQVSHPAEVDHRADIYALGVVFYQMLTGELPGTRIAPPSKRVHVDVRLDEVVLRALEKKPELRFQQASALKTCVETIAAEEDSLPRSVREESAHADGTPLERPSRHVSQRFAIAGGVLGLLLLLGFIWKLSRGMSGRNGNIGVTVSPPHITSVIPNTATPGSRITIAGENFGTSVQDNLVMFGSVRAQVLSTSNNVLSVVAPTGATYAPITVTKAGLAAYSPKPFQPTFSGNAGNISTSSLMLSFDLRTGDGPYTSAIADLDGDGWPDIAVADAHSHTISLLRNIGTAGNLTSNSFAARVTLPTEAGGKANPYDLIAADVDGDGSPDLVVGDHSGNNISVFHNLASPGSLNSNSFAARVNFPVGDAPHYARVADLDGDGRPDIVCCDLGADTISVLQGTGRPGRLDTNSFAKRVSLPTNLTPYDLTIGDFDGDGKPDLAVTHYNKGVLSLFRNQSAPGGFTTNSFAARVDLPAVAGNSTIVTGDLDNDGKLDLVLSSSRRPILSVYRNQATPGLLDTNSFSARVEFPNENWTSTVRLSDLNGDTKPDIAVVGMRKKYLSVFQNLSTPGSFTTNSLGKRVDFIPDLAMGQVAYGLSIGDLDGDHRPEVVYCNTYRDTISVYRNVMPFAPPSAAALATPSQWDTVKR